MAAVKRFKEPKGRDRILTYAEEDRLLAALPEPHRTVTQLALECGARLQSELLPLTWADVDLDRQQVHIKGRDAKNGKGRVLPLSDGMVARLRGLPASSRSAFVFPAARGGLLHRFKVRYFKAVRAVGLAGTGVGIHTLRHTWASRLAESSGDLLLLQKLGGWSSLDLVQRYSHVREGREAEAIRRMVEGRESHRMPDRRGHRGVANSLNRQAQPRLGAAVW